MVSLAAAQEEVPKDVETRVVAEVEMVVEEAGLVVVVGAVGVAAGMEGTQGVAEVASVLCLVQAEAT